MRACISLLAILIWQCDTISTFLNDSSNCKFEKWILELCKRRLHTLPCLLYSGFI
jgi:hypothetical protein